MLPLKVVFPAMVMLPAAWIAPPMPSAVLFVKFTLRKVPDADWATETVPFTAVPAVPLMVRFSKVVLPALSRMPLTGLMVALPVPAKVMPAGRSTSISSGETVPLTLTRLPPSPPKNTWSPVAK